MMMHGLGNFKFNYSIVFISVGKSGLRRYKLRDLINQRKRYNFVCISRKFFSVTEPRTVLAELNLHSL